MSLLPPSRIEYPEHGGSRLHWNVGTYLPNYVAWSRLVGIALTFYILYSRSACFESRQKCFHGIPQSTCATAELIPLWRHMREWTYSCTILDLDTNGGEWSASRLGRFAPGKEPQVSIGLEVEWAPELVWTTWKREILPLSGLEIRPLSRPARSQSLPTELSRVIYVRVHHTYLNTWQLIMDDLSENLKHRLYVYISLPPLHFFTASTVNVMTVTSWSTVNIEHRSVLTATGWTARVRFPTEARNCSPLYSVQTGSGARPPSYPLDTGGGVFPRR
jgi:hypothetical protein